jgi:hypothetical protein
VVFGLLAHTYLAHSLVLSRQFGVSYDEGTVPRGLGGLGICNYMYCPDNHDGILRNPKQESTNPWSVKWDSWNWNNYDGDENVYTVCHPNPCLIYSIPSPSALSAELSG